MSLPTLSLPPLTFYLPPCPQDKPTERPAGWHPGPHGHELRAQILAWNYLRVLADAIR